MFNANDDHWLTNPNEPLEGFPGVYASPTTTLETLPSRGEVINGFSGLTDEGYPINDGNSWVMTVEFTDDGPRAEAVLRYSQSEDPASPHYLDQSRLYADGEFREIRFTEAEILADPNLYIVHLSR